MHPRLLPLVPSMVQVVLHRAPHVVVVGMVVGAREAPSNKAPRPHQKALQRAHHVRASRLLNRDALQALPPL